MVRSATLVIVAGLVASCTGGPEQGRAPRANPAMSPVQRVDTKRAGLEIGVPYRIEVYTHCGIDFWTKFDGSYWDAINHDNESGNPPKGLANPLDFGTMSLISRDRARYESASGRVFLFRREPQRQPSGMIGF
jgi:hypothetical protein